jgi:hypothetical protein
MRSRMALGIVLALAVAAGCATPRLSNPARTATEQLLVSAAAELALAQVDAAPLAGRTVFVDATHLEATDKGYVLGSTAARLNQGRALLAAERDKAEVVAALRAGALSVDRSEFLIGVPSLSVPTPFGGQVRTPEVALLKKVRQAGVAKLALHAYEAASGRHVLSTGPLSGTSYYTLWTILGVTFRVTNLPEKAPWRSWWPWGAGG